MKFLTTCIAILVILIAQKVEAKSFKDAAGFVSSIKKNGEVLAYESITGNFDNDGKEDLVLLIHYADSSRSYYRIAVLIKNKRNLFDLFNMSKAGDTSDGLSAELKQKVGGSLFVYTELPSGFWGTYQFKIINNTITLIGSEIHLSSCQSDQDRCLVVETSINFLTGRVILHKQITGGKKTINLLSKLKVSLPHCELNNFNFDPYFCVDNIKTNRGMLDALMRGEK